MRRLRLSEFHVGLLALGLIVLLILLAFTRYNPFSSPYELQAGFNDARNIGIGSPVRIAGVEVGRVSKLESNGDGAATVTMELEDEALPIHTDATLKIRPRILLEGNYFVDVSPGSGGAPELDDGSTVPATQTATSVSLPEVLATLTTDTRTDLRTLLREYGTEGLGQGGAEALNRSIPYFAPAYRRTAITNEALLGLRPNRDLRRLLRGQARTFGALVSRPEQLKDLVSDLGSVAGALASQDTALAASVPALRDTLAVGYPALADVDAALPSLRRFSVEALPSVRSTAPTLDVAIPWIAQASALVQPEELRGLAADLRRAVPSLVRLNKRLVPLNAELRALSSCTSSVLVPFAESAIPSIEAQNSGQEVRRQIFRSFVGLAGESRVQDANSQVFHIQGVIPSNLANGRIEPAAPVDANTPPVHRPDVACETQDPPVLAAPGGAAPTWSGTGVPVRHAIRVHLFDFLAILGLLVVALTITVVILSEQGFRFPIVEESPKHIEVELADAQAVEPGRGQTVRVAGVEIGKIAGVQLEDGVAVVELDIEPTYEDMVREDATALLRPKTALKDMFLEVDPGTGQVVPEGGRIGVGATASDVDPDEILAALDNDTRPYLKLLVAGAGKGLRDHGEDLNATLRRLEPLHRDLARVTQATARRRKALKRLIHSYSLLTAELGRHPADLERLVSASGEVFGALAGEDDDIATAAARLPGALRQSADTLGEVGAFARELRPTLDALVPPIRRLDESNAALRPFLAGTTPVLRDQIRPFVRAARPWTADLRTATVEGAKAAPDLRRSLAAANRFFNIGAFNPGGAEGLGGLGVNQQRAREEGFLYWLAWTAQNGVSLFNTADAQGPWRRVTICGLELGQLQPLLSFTLRQLSLSDPGLLEQVSGATDGSIVPGSPVQNLLDSRFGTCDFSDLPTVP